jgi:hypothetical protein
MTKEICYIFEIEQDMITEANIDLLRDKGWIKNNNKISKQRTMKNTYHS